MGDLRLWNRAMITEFIELYKSHPCLWNTKSEEYNNKYKKSQAYKDLTKFCMKRGVSDANRDFVTRKIQSLRGSFRKEVRKVNMYQKEGKPYESNLWYFNNLLFTLDIRKKGDENQSDEDYDDDATCEVYDDDDGNEEKVDVDEEIEERIEIVPSFTADSPQPASPQPRKRKKLSETCLQTEFIDIGQDTKKELSEHELIGLNVTKKLSRMDETQAIFAEFLINNVLRKGLLKKLKEETDLCNNLCGKGKE